MWTLGLQACLWNVMCCILLSWLKGVGDHAYIKSINNRLASKSGNSSTLGIGLKCEVLYIIKLIEGSGWSFIYYIYKEKTGFSICEHKHIGVSSENWGVIYC